MRMQHGCCNLLSIFISISRFGVWNLESLQRFIENLPWRIRPCRRGRWWPEVIYIKVERNLLWRRWPKVERIKIESNNLWWWSRWHWRDVLQAFSFLVTSAMPRHCHTECTGEVHWMHTSYTRLNKIINMLPETFPATFQTLEYFLQRAIGGWK